MLPRTTLPHLRPAPTAAAQRTRGPAPPAVRPVYAAKAWFDLSCAALLFVGTLPLMVLTCLAVRLTSTGPAIYSQSRVGRAGRVFTIYKFRTMAHNCELASGIQWSVRGDSRITPLGHWLRKLHLDELPQLVNVLRGEMSLVGPRPERPEIVADLQLSIVNYDVRHTVLPGITGFAQVHLPPDSSILTVKNKLIYDRFYISRLGLRMDVYCLACTLLKVVGLKKLYQRSPRRPAGSDE